MIWIVRLYGVPLLDRPLTERRATLERLDVSGLDPVAFSPLYPDGAALLEVTGQRGMEGIVAKRGDAPYRPGRRSPSWVKVTHRLSQSCVVGGWRPERTSPGRVGALLLGVYDGGDLVFAGRAGSGLAGSVVQQVLTERLGPLDTGRSPFAQPLPRVDAAGAHWCTPETVVEIAHGGWTVGGRLRAPVFRGIRDDVDPGEVVRET